MSSRVLGLLLLVLATVGAADLPGGIKSCKGDATLDECATKTAKATIKSIVKGDKKFRIPVLDPLYIESLVLTENATKSFSLNLTLEKLNLHGLADTDFLKSQMDTKKKTIKWTFGTKELKFLSDYELSGKFLLVPVTGKGKSSIILVQPVFIYTFDYILKDIKGKQHAEIRKSSITYETKQIKFHFENLFNGDKTLGDNVNKLLNENWTELSKMWGPGFTKALAAVCDSIISNVIKIIPYNQFILPV